MTGCVGERAPRGKSLPAKCNEPRRAGTICPKTRTLCCVASLGHSVCDKIAAGTVWNLLSSCDHSKNTGRPFFSRRVSWEGIGDTCSGGLVLQCAAGVRTIAVSLFFPLFLPTRHGRVPWDLGLTVVRHLFFPLLLIIFPEILSSVRVLPYEARGGSEKRLYRCFVYLCACVGLGVI